MSGLKAKYWESLRLQIENKIGIETKEKPPEENFISAIFKMSDRNKKILVSKLLNIGKDYHIVSNEQIYRLKTRAENLQKQNKELVKQHGLLEKEVVKLETELESYSNREKEIVQLRNELDETTQELEKTRNGFDTLRGIISEEAKEKYREVEQQRSVKQERPADLEIEDWLDI